MTHTKDMLAAALREAGLSEMMVDRASRGYYHDFMSPLDTPTLMLCEELAKADTPAALALRRRVVNGDFDSTKEEADDWAKSPEGQEAFNKLKDKL